MRSTILHVEDDPALVDVVQLSFEGFGFRGTMLTAETVGEATKILEDMAHHRRAIDLIISDMTLPDGTGLDVVRRVRWNSAWQHTPILILSGDADPHTVGRAYALGATAYVSKAPCGRSIGEVVKTLYDHWLRDVVPPGAPQVDRTERFLERAITIRSRHAAFYMRMAEQFGDSPSEVAFWLTRALSESNLTNLLTFLKRQVDDHTLSAELLDEIEHVQTDIERALTAFERELEVRPITTHDEASRRTLELVSNVASSSRLQPYLRAISQLFPVAPVALEALCDFLAGYLEDLARWGDLHAGDPVVNHQSTSLRATAAYLRTLPEDRTASVAEPG